MTNISNENLFKQLYFSKTEKDVEDVILNNPNVFRDDNWFPLGGNENMFGIVRNQQSAYSGGYPFSISGDIRSVPS